MKMIVVSKESVRVNYKDGIYAHLRLNLQFGGNRYFCYITEPEWFRKRCQETKFQTIT